MPPRPDKVRSKQKTQSKPIPALKTQNRSNTSAKPNAQIKPNIIAIYGISGCGKSYLLTQLKHHLPQKSYNFYDGSQSISQAVPGGLPAFLQMDEPTKNHWRKVAGEAIKTDCAQSGKIGIVAGHLMLWENGTAVRVVRDEDLRKYSRAFYLYVPSKVLVERRERDKARTRPSLSQRTLRYWQRCEREELRRSCRELGIFYMEVKFYPLESYAERVIALINFK